MTSHTFNVIGNFMKWNIHFMKCIHKEKFSSREQVECLLNETFIRNTSCE